MREAIKHLIECKCILLQFRKMPDPPLHKFIVFSEIEENGDVVPSVVQCPNCGAVHKIKEVGLSEILRKEDVRSALTIDEIKTTLPPKLLNDLTGYDLELHQWMEIQWIMENEKWDRPVILTKENADGLIAGKYIQILSPSLWKFGKFSREDSLAEI